jgi:hypothetical protein
MGTLYLDNRYRDRARQWCQHNVGPRLYFLHNREGGHEWCIKPGAEEGKGFHITVADDRKLTILALTIVD